MKLLPLSFAFVLAAGLAGCGRHSEAASAPSLPPASVRVATVRAATVAPTIDVAGIVRPMQRAQLAAKVMGSIAEMPVTLGQNVHAGDVLVRISAAEISARVVQAQSQLNAARRDLERERALLTKGASTADMVRGLEDRLAGAEAMVREAEAMLGYATIRAPFDGVVARKMANAGDLAAPGMPLLEVEGTGDFQVDAAIPDSLVATLSPGATVPVDIPARGLSFSGKLAELSSAADASARSVLARIAVPAGTTVRSGEFARVHLAGPPARTLLVPAGAVSVAGQLERVFVANADHRAALRLVKTGASRGDQVEILAGLDDGEQVVVAPPAGLRETQPLQIQP